MVDCFVQLILHVVLFLEVEAWQVVHEEGGFRERFCNRILFISLYELYEHCVHNRGQLLFQSNSKEAKSLNSSPVMYF